PGVSPTVALTEATPIATVTLPTAVGQARIAVTIAPATSGGAMDASIRIPRLTGPTTLDAFVAGGHIPAYVAEFLRALVRARRSIVIGGPVHAGKTTLLASLCAEIPDADVVLTIEEGPELALKRPRRDGTVVHEHTLEHVTVPGGAGWERDKVSFADHARHALRYDAQWIVLGEARGAEMADVLAAMTVGVPGMCTVHADHASMIMTKVYSYVVKAPEYSGNLALARELAWLAIDVAVHMEHRAGRHEITGIVAYNEHGGETVVYERGAHGGLERRAESIDDLPPRLRDPLRPYLDEVPGP
ncbi:MAG TPA: ATPase, T2SS/T4P/T4SS family, partial [Candidatus Dormibacteraeota bacterium]|nr:ATPase, T2SS/T4P/T4SS family [Candidatus Dormibacteraeota bacterium]